MAICWCYCNFFINPQSNIHQNIIKITHRRSQKPNVFGGSRNQPHLMCQSVFQCCCSVVADYPTVKKDAAENKPKKIMFLMFLIIIFSLSFLSLVSRKSAATEKSGPTRLRTSAGCVAATTPTAAPSRGPSPGRRRNQVGARRRRRHGATSQSKVSCSCMNHFLPPRARLFKYCLFIETNLSRIMNVFNP